MLGKNDPTLPSKENPMRFMILVKATKDTEAGIMPTGKEMDDLMGAMAAFHEEMAKAGVLLDASGLQPSAKGWRVKYDGKKRTIMDGPFAEAKELVAGYTLIQAKSKEEAMEWSRRFPNPAGEGKQASSKGARVKFSGGKTTVKDGPFTESKELVAGFWIWQVKSLAEAIDWLKQAPFENGE